MASPISRDPAEEGETGSVAGQPDQDLNPQPDRNQAGNRGQMGSTDQRTDQDTDQDQMGSLGEGGVGRDMNYSGGAADTNRTPGYTGPYANPTDTGGAVPGASPGYSNANPDYADTPPADTSAAPGTMGKMTAPDENRGTMGNTGQTGAQDTMSDTGLSGAPSPADTSDTGLTGGMAPNERERMQSGMPDTPDTPDSTGQGLSGDQGMTPGTRQGGV